MGATSQDLLGLVPSRIAWHQVALGPCMIPRDLLRGEGPLEMEAFIHLSAPIVTAGWPMGGRRARSRERAPSRAQDGWRPPLARASQPLPRPPPWSAVSAFPSASCHLPWPSLGASGGLEHSGNEQTPPDHPAFLSAAALTPPNNLPGVCVRGVTRKPRLIGSFAFQRTSASGKPRPGT